MTVPAPHRFLAEPIPLTPDPVAFHLGPLPVQWYGLCYLVGLAAAYAVMVHEARRRGLDPGIVDRGLVVVTIAGLAGGRIYHVVDQWDRYSADPWAIVLPPYAGLGVFGAIIGGALALVVVLRVWEQSFWRWADVVAVGAFVMQAVARWGNFFNQELYGPPTDLPWGIAIQCGYRTAQWPCTAYPEATTGFQPLFLYESLSGVLGAATLLWVARRWGARDAAGRPVPGLGDLVLGRAVRPGVAARRQLDHRRRPDGDDRLRGPGDRRGRRARLAASADRGSRGPLGRPAGARGRRPWIVAVT